MINLNKPITHNINGEFCSCGSDACSCQVCGKRVCGMQAEWLTPVPNKSFDGNVCHGCLPKTLPIQKNH